MSKHYMPPSIQTVTKIFLVLREKLCDGDNQHPFRKYLTVKKAEKYSSYVDTLYKK